jgi:hypothetical protein
MTAVPTALTPAAKRLVESSAVRGATSNGSRAPRYRDHLTILRLADFDSWNASMTSRKVRGRPDTPTVENASNLLSGLAHRHSRSPGPRASALWQIHPLRLGKASD